MNLGSSLEPSAHRVSAIRQSHGLFLRAYRFAQTALETQNARRLLDPLALSFQLTRNRARATSRRVAGSWGRSSRCREPSWRENIELPAKKAIKCENIYEKYSHIRWLCSWLELQSAPVGKSVRKLVVVLRINKKVGIANSQINWLLRAIFSN